MNDIAGGRVAGSNETRGKWVCQEHVDSVNIARLNRALQWIEASLPCQTKELSSEGFCA
eukprot:m.113858 g.113858  ORF g.113858 m.113858 type:complete len:59 (+) comp9431_c0_seq3:572-748(+)